MKRRTFAKWAILALVNGLVVLLFAVWVQRNFSVIVYRKHAVNPFAQELSQVKAAQPGQVRTVEASSLELRQPHPYAGFKTEQGVHSSDGAYRINAKGHRSDELGAKSKGTLRVAIVGGSVAFGGSRNEFSIIAYLAKQIAKLGYSVEYINAGVVSHISNQELSMLVHDLLLLDIDLLVSFDGYNDIYNILHYNGRIGWPAMRWDNTAAGANLGQMAPSYYPPLPPDPRLPTEGIEAVLDNYLTVLKTMAAICEKYGITYISCLQPKRNWPVALGDTTLDGMDYFYTRAVQELQSLDSTRHNTGRYISLAGFLHDHPELFTDECHFIDRGNELVAAKLFEVLLAGDFFAQHPVPPPAGDASAPGITLAPDGTALLHDGRLIPIAGGNAGSLDLVSFQGDDIVFEGWAGNAAPPQGADSVVIFVNGAPVAQGKPGIERPDVAQAFGAALASSGFRISLPVAASGLIRGQDIKAFALFADGTAKALAFDPAVSLKYAR